MLDLIQNEDFLRCLKYVNKFLTEENGIIDKMSIVVNEAGDKYIKARVQTNALGSFASRIRNEHHYSVVVHTVEIEMTRMYLTEPMLLPDEVLYWCNFEFRIKIKD